MFRDAAALQLKKAALTIAPALQPDPVCQHGLCTSARPHARPVTRTVHSLQQILCMAHGMHAV